MPQSQARAPAVLCLSPLRLRRRLVRMTASEQPKISAAAAQPNTDSLPVLLDFCFLQTEPCHSTELFHSVADAALRRPVYSTREQREYHEEQQEFPNLEWSPSGWASVSFRPSRRGTGLTDCSIIACYEQLLTAGCRDKEWGVTCKNIIGRNIDQAKLTGDPSVNGFSFHSRQ